MNHFNLIIPILLAGAVAPTGGSRDYFPSGRIYALKECPQKTVLYPEGFVLRRGRMFSFGGEPCCPLNEGLNEVTLTDSAGRETVVPVEVVTSSESAIRKKRARVLCFGESTTATMCRDPLHPTGEGKNWVSFAQEILPSSIGMVGNIGHGGWAVYTYLNWPCAAKLDPHASRNFFKPQTMWYALGLATREGKEFDGSRAQLDTIVLTPFGKYPADGHASLWELLGYLGTQPGYPSFSEEGPYRGADSQIRAIRRWTEELMSHPINEFYDRDTAKVTDHAFSLNTYLKRYSEKKPSAVIVNIGINDGDGANSVQSSEECFLRLIKCFYGIPVAHFVMRWPGVCDKSLWPGYVPRQYDINGNTFNLLRLQEVWRKIEEIVPDFYELDVWHCQYPASQLGEYLSPDGVVSDRNDVHTGYRGQESAAWQAVCWLHYILSR